MVFSKKVQGGNSRSFRLAEKRKKPTKPIPPNAEIHDLSKEQPGDAREEKITTRSATRSAADNNPDISSDDSSHESEGTSDFDSIFLLLLLMMNLCWVIFSVDGDDDYLIDGDLEDADEENDAKVIDRTLAFRLSVAFIFSEVFQCSTDEPWTGKGGIAPQIRKMLQMPQIKTKYIVDVMERVVQAKVDGVRYQGKHLENETRGRKPIIELDSECAQVIADAIESGFSHPGAWFLANQHLKEEVLPSVTLSAVYTCVHRMKPKETIITKKQQGSNNDENAPSCKARFRFHLQLAIRTGEISPQEAVFYLRAAGYNYEVQTLPNYYKKEKLTPLDIAQYSTYDEVHRVVQEGSDAVPIITPNKKIIYRFPRDKNGRIDLVNGEYEKEEVALINAKYSQEVRLSLGVAVIRNDQGELEGKRLPPFVYSGKTMLSIKDFEKKIQAEIRRVKNLKHGETGGWVTTPETTKGRIYRDDSIMKLTGVGPKSAEIFHEKGIRTIEDMFTKCLDEKLEKEMVEALRDKTLMKKIRDQFLEPGKIWLNEGRPRRVDYRQSPNPYEARYGPDWKEEVKKVYTMTSFVCVSDLVDHIYRETKKVYEGTEYSENFFFYHDALSLMTAIETRKYMEKEGIMKHWILPEQGLFDDDPVLAPYRGRPVGNSPNLCSLDSCLNRDIHTSVNDHVRFTMDMKKGDVRKFSLATPKLGTRAYLRIVDPEKGVAPSSKRIIQDQKGVFQSLRKVVEAKGMVIPDINNTGRRRVVGAQYQKRRGGHRKRKQRLDDYGDSRIGKRLHEDAKVGLEIKLEASSKKFCAGGMGDV